jgi:hypothetical protein
VLDVWAGHAGVRVGSGGRAADGADGIRAGAVERAHCDAGVPGPGHRGGLHPLRRLRHVDHTVLHFIHQLAMEA